MKGILIVVLSVLLLPAIAQGQTTPAPIVGKAENANQWWAEAKALGQKAATLKKARYEARAKVNARISETATKEFIKRPSKPLAEIYDELRQKAAPEFAAINQQYNPQITEAMDRYVAFLREPKPDAGEILAASMALRPEILYQEKAKYTEAARQNRVQGTVLLSIVFSADGRISNVRVVRGLPDEINDEAVKAANEIVFLPALKNWRPVSVRMSVEYTFNLI
jgi:TonB family protein